MARMKMAPFPYPDGLSDSTFPALQAPKGLSRLEVLRNEYQERSLRAKEEKMVAMLTQQQERITQRITAAPSKNKTSLRAPEEKAWASNWTVTKRTTGIDRAHPLKPVYHRHANLHTASAAGTRPKPPDQEYVRSKSGPARPNAWQQLEKSEANLEAEIRRKEALLREKLRRTEEELRRIQREKEEEELQERGRREDRRGQERGRLVGSGDGQGQERGRQAGSGDGQGQERWRETKEKRGEREAKEKWREVTQARGQERWSEPEQRRGQGTWKEAGQGRVQEKLRETEQGRGQGSWREAEERGQERWRETEKRGQEKLRKTEERRGQERWQEAEERRGQDIWREAEMRGQERWREDGQGRGQESRRVADQGRGQERWREDGQGRGQESWREDGQGTGQERWREAEAMRLREGRPQKSPADTLHYPSSRERVEGTYGRTTGEHHHPELKMNREASPSPTDSTSDWVLKQGEAEPSEDLIPCRLCGRRFMADRLEKHTEVCRKMQASKRKVFDSSKARAKGTDLEQFLHTKGRSQPPAPQQVKGSSWRQKHESFIRTIRQARVVQIVISRGGKPSELPPPPPPEENPDYVPCPHCTRRFAPRVAERHIPKCETIRNKPRPPPARRHHQR